MWMGQAEHRDVQGPANRARCRRCGRLGPPSGRTAEPERGEVCGWWLRPVETGHRSGCRCRRGERSRRGGRRWLSRRPP